MTNQEIDLMEIEARMMSGEPFTFMNLHSISRYRSDTYRLADRTIQKWRRKGWISFVRKGHSPVWSLTELGKSEAKPKT